MSYYLAYNREFNEKTLNKFTNLCKKILVVGSLNILE